MPNANLFKCQKCGHLMPDSAMKLEAAGYVCSSGCPEYKEEPEGILKQHFFQFGLLFEGAINSETGEAIIEGLSNTLGAAMKKAVVAKHKYGAKNTKVVVWNRSSSRKRLTKEEVENLKVVKVVE